VFEAAREAPFSGGTLFKGLCASAYSSVNAFIVCEECYTNGTSCQEIRFIYGIYLNKVCHWSRPSYGVAISRVGV
jgi:hypothetical protein